MSLSGNAEKLLNPLIFLVAAATGGGFGGSSAFGGGSDDAPAGPFKQGKGEDPEVVEFIRRKALEVGIDPNVALRVARSEALRGFHPSRGEWSAGSNDRGTSFGPFQAHFKNNIPGLSLAGQGDVMAREGINARDITQWKRVIEWQLRYAKQHGWSEWHGWRGHPRAGLDRAPMSRDEADKQLGVERRSEDARVLDEQRPASVPVNSYPQTWRTRVTISKPPGGDMTQSANALAHN